MGWQTFHWSNSNKMATSRQYGKVNDNDDYDGADVGVDGVGDHENTSAKIYLKQICMYIDRHAYIKKGIPVLLMEGGSHDTCPTISEGTCLNVAAASDNGIPRRTLGYRYNRRALEDTKIGAPCKLSHQSHDNLSINISYMAQKAFPITVNQSMMHAWAIDKSRRT